MRKRLCPIVIALSSVLAGCVPGVAEYSKSEAPNDLRVDGATREAALAFAPGSARLVAGEAARLDRLVANGDIRPADRVEIAASGPPPLAQARSDAIASRLLRWGIVADASPLAGVPRNRAVVMVGRYAVTLPRCPNWSQSPSYHFSEALPSWYGCDDATNLGLMVASPADLAGGRVLAAADGQLAASAVEHYLDDKVKELPSETASPFTAPSGGGGASGGGGGQ